MYFYRSQYGAAAKGRAEILSERGRVVASWSARPLPSVLYIASFPRWNPVRNCMKKTQDKGLTVGGDGKSKMDDWLEGERRRSANKRQLHFSLQIYLNIYKKLTNIFDYRCVRLNIERTFFFCCTNWWRSSASCFSRLSFSYDSLSSSEL